MKNTWRGSQDTCNNKVNNIRIVKNKVRIFGTNYSFLICFYQRGGGTSGGTIIANQRTVQINFTAKVRAVYK